MINIFTFQNVGEAMDLNALRAFALEFMVNGEFPGAPLQPHPEENRENVDAVLQCQHN